MSDSHQEGGCSTKGPRVIVMAQTTCTPQQGRHHAPIQSWLHPQTLLLGSLVLRALQVRKTSSRITPDMSTERIEPARIGPLGRLWPHQSLDTASYLVSFIDDSTRKVWAYPIRTKDRVFSIFSDWLAMVENQSDQKLKCLQTDNGGDFKSYEFVQFCRERGIRREYMAPYSPEQNGIAERMNQTIQERVVSMLQHSGLSDSFWAEALLTAVHIINMSPSRPLGLQIPQQLWTDSKPNYDKLRIFRCEAYALVPKDDRQKL